MASNRGESESKGLAKCFVAWLALILLLRLLTTGAYHAAAATLSGGDSRTYYLTAQRSIAGESLYQKDLDYCYTPLLAFVVRPLTHFSMETTGKIWVAVEIALAVAGV